MAQKPMIAQKVDAEMKKQKQPMADEALAQAKDKQKKFSLTSSGLGVTGLGLLGTAGGAKLLKKPAAAKKLRDAAMATSVTAGGVGALSGINFARIQGEEARRTREIKKDNFGIGFSKAWDDEKKKYPFTVSGKAHDPEKSRQRRARAYTPLMGAGAVGAGALAVAAAKKKHVPIPKDTPVDVRVLNNKAVRVGSALAASGALGAGAAHNAPKKNRREIKGWYPDDERNPKKYVKKAVKNPAPAVKSSKEKYPHLKKKARAAAVASEYVQQ